MNTFFYNLFDRVRIKETGVPGSIVEIDDNGGRNPPIFMVELDDDFKTGDFTTDCWWHSLHEIEPMTID